MNANPDMESDLSFVKRVLRQSGSSFGPAAWLVPRRHRLAYLAAFAVARYTDDLVDEPGYDANRGERRESVCRSA